MNTKKMGCPLGHTRKVMEERFEQAKKLAEEKGMFVKEIAEELGVTPTAIGSMFRRRGFEPDYHGRNGRPIGATKKVTEQRRADIMSMMRQNYSFSDMSQLLKISPTAIRQHLKIMGIRWEYRPFVISVGESIDE